jgi:aromatic ring-opening dioxygenase catalytic subunit (LigB family)
MSTENTPRLTPRRALGAGLAAAAVVAALPSFGGNGGGAAPAKPDDAPGSRRTGSSSSRLPVAYVPHGGGPWPFVEMGMQRSEVDGLLGYLRGLRGLPKTPPKALLVISAHWEAAVPTVTTGTNPPLLFDYYGFPPASYELTWPAAGDPALASRVQSLLGAAGFPTAVDAKRGFDHGTFVPFKVAYPEADVPTVQLSLKAGLDPETHLAMGRALAPLRDEGVFILGSGMSFHNMRGFGSGRAGEMSEPFDTWLREAATLEPAARDQQLAQWSKAPGARLAHPREEHLLPLMVIAGAAGADRGTLAHAGTMMGAKIAAYHFG